MTTSSAMTTVRSLSIGSIKSGADSRPAMLFRRSISERVAMKLTGHKMASVFQHYNFANDGIFERPAQPAGLTSNTSAKHGALR